MTADLVIEWVTVGNAGNAADDTGYGAVAYEFRISKYEVTNAQYTLFLNAVGQTDTYSLYDPNMGSDSRGGIVQSGSPGSYSYATKANMDNKPVNYVSFWDAARFSNWLQNGQPSGLQGPTTTETGAYTIDLFGQSITETRNPAAQFFVPSEDEWYKAAYHKNDGVTGNYFDYATSSDLAPTVATANAVGDIDNPGVNVANYAQGADWNGSNGNLTTVGSAGVGSASPYSTLDQSGNVAEITEGLITSTVTSRVARGGRFSDTSSFFVSAASRAESGFGGASSRGFRLAAVASVPEPSSWLLCGIIAIGTLGRRGWARICVVRGIPSAQIPHKF